MISNGIGMGLKKGIKKLVGYAKRHLYSQVDVFLFHAVSEQFDEKKNLRVDWISTQEFKQLVTKISRDYVFVSLEEAKKILDHKIWKGRAKYAVLTCDDGYRSVLDILPFLEAKEIPITLFLNPKYLDGVSKREDYVESPEYIGFEDLRNLNAKYVSIGMHGYEHVDVTKQEPEAFRASLRECVSYLNSQKCFIPYFAYTWGKCNQMTQEILTEEGIVPVFADGKSNYGYCQGISRKAIECYQNKK